MRRLLVLVVLLVAAPAWAGRPRKIIAYGDSLWDGGSTGFNCDTCGAYPARWNVFEWSCLSFVDPFTLGSEGVRSAEESAPLPAGAAA
jgi:hypothetical protein